jgi:hypothetical protein
MTIVKEERDRVQEDVMAECEFSFSTSVGGEG